MFPPQPLLPDDPGELEQYMVLGRIGIGGMGIVYLACDESGRRVAIKVIRAELAADRRFRERFRREADHARRVAPTYTAPLLDVNFGKQPFLVTEYIEGPSLGERIQERGPMSSSETELLARHVASALRAIHGAQLVHRDLKPSNVVLGDAGPRVIDFGIARALDDTSRLTSSGVLLGTPEFMAPEQFDEDGEETAATDVFAWGGLVAFARTGQPPFGRAPERGATAFAALGYRVRYQQPRLVGLEAPLRELVQSAMAKDPADRPSARELVSQLTPDDSPVGKDQSRVADERLPQSLATLSKRAARAPDYFGLAAASGVPRNISTVAGRLFRDRLAAMIGLAATILLFAVMGLLTWWLFLGIVAHTGMIMLLAAESVLGVVALIGGGMLVRELAKFNPGASLAVGVGLFAAIIIVPVFSYHGLHDRYWVGLDRGRVVILKGAGPGGFSFLHVHETSVVERFSIESGNLPPLVADTLNYGIGVTGRDEGQQVARCLPLVFSRVPDTPVGPGNNADLCADPIFGVPPWMLVPQPTTLPDTTDYPPSLLASDDRVLLAWTARSDGHIHIRSSTDGMHFSAAVALSATSDDAPALATDGSRFFMAWTQPDGHLALMSSTDGTHFGSPVRLEQTSKTAPALSYGNGTLLLAWIGDNENHLHVMASPDGLKFGEETVLDDTSEIAPNLIFADHVWYVSWVGRSDQKVNVALSNDGLSFYGKVVWEATTDYRPAMAVRDTWFLAWTRGEDTGIGLLISKSASSDFVNELRLAEASGGVSLANFGGEVLLAWRDLSFQPVLHVARLA